MLGLITRMIIKSMWEGKLDSAMKCYWSVGTLMLFA